jgi:site-specific recombinase XerD
MLRHTFVTTMLDAGVDLRDVQIAARHAAHMASGT